MCHQVANQVWVVGCHLIGWKMVIELRGAARYCWMHIKWVVDEDAMEFNGVTGCRMEVESVADRFFCSQSWWWVGFWCIQSWWCFFCTVRS